MFPLHTSRIQIIREHTPTDRKSDEPGNRWPPPSPPSSSSVRIPSCIESCPFYEEAWLRELCEVVVVVEDDFKRDFYKKTSV